MATNVIMPSMGFDMTEGKVARWLKREGEPVTRGEAIGEIETEKATIELEANADGVLKQILVQAGETVPVNTPIAIIAAPDEQVGTAQAAPSASAPQAQEEKTRAQPAPAPVEAPSAEDGRIKASPLARNIAQAEGLDLAAIKGSGPGGRIIERDVQQALAARPKAKPAPPAPKQPAPAEPQPTRAQPTAPAPAAQAAPTGGEKPLSKMRQAIAQRMTQSKTTAPHFYVTFEINMTEAMKVREQLNALAADGQKISVNDFIIAAAARTLVKHPTFNASYQGNALALHEDINIGIAVALDDGLITPVLHNADQKTIRQIATEAKAVTERARTNKLRAEDLGPGTFTISNLGMFGVDEFSAIINPPEAAILAVGAVSKQPVVIDDQVKVGQVMKATLSVDHRVADGAQAARFMQDLKKLLENPVNLLLTD